MNLEFREKMELCVYGDSPGETIRFLHYDPFGVRDGVLQFENEMSPADPHAGGLLPAEEVLDSDWLDGS